MVTIAYLGPAGTFSEEAAFLRDDSAELIPCISHAKVIQRVLKGEANAGVVARENSIGGSVYEVVDPLITESIGIIMTYEEGVLREKRGVLMVSGEILLPITQCLYLGPNVLQQNVRTVFSHPQGLGQCSNFLRATFPDAELIPTSSTVAAIEKMLGDKSIPAAAIAPRRAGIYYPTARLVRVGIEDQLLNTTRFLVVSKEDCREGGSKNKTSICFTVPEDEKPGSFDRVSQIFASCGVNKRLVESRPTKTELGKYVFLMDIDGHRDDRVIRLIFELIVMAGLTTTLKILGSYPRFRQGSKRDKADLRDYRNFI